MAAVNYYLGLARGQSGNLGNVVVGTVSNGTNSDVEVRVQVNNGTNATGITRLDVLTLLEDIKHYIMSNGIPKGEAGTDLPVL